MNTANQTAASKPEPVRGEQKKTATHAKTHERALSAELPNWQPPAKPDPMYRLPKVIDITGVGRTTIYAGAHAGTFPKPVRLSVRCVAWRESEILKWLADRPQALEAKA